MTGVQTCALPIWIEVTSDESESGIQNDQSSQFSEASNAQTVTHDRATSPGEWMIGVRVS